MMRAGRMLAQGDLRLIALALIAEQPRHGYEIIKVLEDKTAGWYSPSPGIVYPTLTYLEEAAMSPPRPRARRSSTPSRMKAARHLEENRTFVDAVLERHERHRRESKADARTLRAPGIRRAARPPSRQGGGATIARPFRRWCAPRSTICARSRRSRSKPTRTPRRRSVEVLARAAQELRRGNYSTFKLSLRISVDHLVSS